MTTFTMQWDNDGLPATSVFDVFLSNLVPSAFLQDVVDAWQLHLRTVVVSSTSLVALTYGGDAPQDRAVGESGSLGGQGSPPNSSYLLNKNATSGRRGRWFLPGLAEDDTFANGTISGTRRAAVDTAANNFLGALAANGGQLRIARADGTFSNIESFSCQELIGVQRRRLQR
uniref:Uncharacterized protein n=1 Tax=uncultured prokaryote TaxID=198431 RepID=A0A0H5Q843_9ZZZZ|nr:hypothetical protein [uncultured prokaryote]